MMIESNDESDRPQIVGGWRKSSASQASDCVQLAQTSDPSLVAMRNSNDHVQGTVFLERRLLGQLLDGIKAGDLDHLIV
jgi:hypothetical protein